MNRCPATIDPVFATRVYVLQGLSPLGYLDAKWLGDVTGAGFTGMYEGYEVECGTRITSDAESSWILAWPKPSAEYE